MVAAITYEQAVHVWSVESGEQKEGLFRDRAMGITLCALSVDWERLASVPQSNTQQILLFNSQEKGDSPVPTSPPPARAKKKIERCAILAASFTTPHLAVRNDTCGAKLWNTVTGKVDREVGIPEQGDNDGGNYVIQLAFSPNGRLIAALFVESRVVIWDSDTLVQVSQFQHFLGWLPTEGSGVGLFFSPDSSLVAVYQAGYSAVWSVVMEKFVLYYENPSDGSGRNYLELYAISSDGGRLAGVDYGNTLFVWDLTRSESTVYSDGDAAHVTSIKREGGERRGGKEEYHYRDSIGQFSPVDPTVLIVAQPSRIEVWKVKEEGWTLQSVIRLREEGEGVESNQEIRSRLTFSPDGRYVAYGSRCWDLSNLAKPDAYTRHRRPPSFGTTPATEATTTITTKDLQAHSFLTYRNGWIHASSLLFSPSLHCPLVPLPSELRRSVGGKGKERVKGVLDNWWLQQQWYTFGECVVVLSEEGEPVLIDCGPLLARAREAEGE
ncbi:hypothetical protein FRB91_003093 [Serendipita sp. 411]|nr:hypothetical protein FRB91_003093 [Serendipita sp. 411]